VPAVPTVPAAPAVPGLLPVRVHLAAVRVHLVAVAAAAAVLAGCSAEAVDTSPTGSATAGAAASVDLAEPVGPGPHVGPGAEAGSAGPPAWFPASDVLRSWDRARARAFAAADVAALRDLYVAGSPAGTADARLLRSYRSRGLRVEGMRMQLLGVDVLQEGPRRLRLRVTDRLAAGVAVGDGLRAPMPRDAATTRVVELHRAHAGARWRVAWVRSARPQASG
jgi:hypothetical protein